MAEPSNGLCALIGRYIQSVTALEVLLMLHLEPSRAWGADALAVQLRGNATAVATHLQFFVEAGFAAKVDADTYRYNAQETGMHALIEELAQVYRERPVALVELIYSEPQRKLRILADAFKIKKD